MKQPIYGGCPGPHILASHLLLNIIQRSLSLTSGKQGHMTKQSSLGVHLSGDLTWREKTREVVKKAQQRLFFLWTLRKFGLPQKLFTNFYQYSSQLWLHDVVLQLHLRGEKSPAVDHQDCIKDHWCFSPTPGKDSVYSAWLIKRAKKIISNYSHPGHPLFSTFPSAGSGSDGHGQKD